MFMACRGRTSRSYWSAMFLVLGFYKHTAPTEHRKDEAPTRAQKIFQKILDRSTTRNLYKAVRAKTG